MYECTAILNVGESGLEYLDEFGDVRVINFEVCGENAARTLKRDSARRCVARRSLTIDLSGDVTRALAFFTQPPISFAAEDRHELAHLCLRIEQIGWKILF